MIIFTEQIEWEDGVPDDDIIVLVKIAPGDVFMGYRDAGAWRDLDGIRVTDPVAAWVYIPEGPREGDPK